VGVGTCCKTSVIEYEDSKFVSGCPNGANGKYKTRTPHILSEVNMKTTNQ
jgi:hypothetical protein